MWIIAVQLTHINMAEQESDDASVTRVYVSGLPPSMTKDQLRSHFAGKYSVTDSHVIPDRRIGFVGFPSHEIAKKAVIYFNKSFIRMSKISVTLAKPVEVKRDPLGQAVPISQRSSRHRERDPRDADVSSRKRKRDIRDDGEQSERPTTEKTQKTGDDNPPETTTVSEVERNVETDVVTSEESLEESVVPETKSDSDWLRGKTSRLLDIIDDEEERARASSGAADAVNAMPETAEPIPRDEDAADLGNADHSESPRIPPIPNARLFIRNLPFDVHEEDLRATFAPYGRISEVSSIFF